MFHALHFLLFLVVFVAMWIGVGLVLSRAGAWSRLAKRYPAPPRPLVGLSFRGCSGRLGEVRYSGVLDFVATPVGVQVSAMVLFRAGHPPFFVPWSEIEIVPAPRRWWNAMRLRFPGVPGAWLDVSEDLGRRLAQAAHASVARAPAGPIA